MGTYVKIAEDDFDDVMNSQRVQFEKRDPDWTKEYIYERDFRDSNGNEFVLRVYSSIDTRDGEARDKGTDAIRAVVLFRQEKYPEYEWKPLFSQKRTHRTPGWDRRLGEKIETLLDSMPEIEYCNDCSGVMVVREGEYGKFYGCASYPDCRHTRPYDKDV